MWFNLCSDNRKCVKDATLLTFCGGLTDARIIPFFFLSFSSVTFNRFLIMEIQFTGFPVFSEEDIIFYVCTVEVLRLSVWFLLLKYVHLLAYLHFLSNLFTFCLSENTTKLTNWRRSFFFFYLNCESEPLTLISNFLFFYGTDLLILFPFM